MPTFPAYERARIHPCRKECFLCVLPRCRRPERSVQRSGAGPFSYSLPPTPHSLLLGRSGGLPAAALLLRRAHRAIRSCLLTSATCPYRLRNLPVLSEVEGRHLRIPRFSSRQMMLPRHPVRNKCQLPLLTKGHGFIRALIFSPERGDRF